MDEVEVAVQTSTCWHRGRVRSDTTNSKPDRPVSNIAYAVVGDSPVTLCGDHTLRGTNASPSRRKWLDSLTA